MLNLDISLRHPGRQKEYSIFDRFKRNSHLRKLFHLNITRMRQENNQLFLFVTGATHCYHIILRYSLHSGHINIFPRLLRAVAAANVPQTLHPQQHYSRLVPGNQTRRGNQNSLSSFKFHFTYLHATTESLLHLEAKILFQDLIKFRLKVAFCTSCVSSSTSEITNES